MPLKEKTFTNLRNRSFSGVLTMNSMVLMLLGTFWMPSREPRVIYMIENLAQWLNIPQNIPENQVTPILVVATVSSAWQQRMMCSVELVFSSGWLSVLFLVMITYRSLGVPSHTKILEGWPNWKVTLRWCRHILLNLGLTLKLSLLIITQKLNSVTWSLWKLLIAMVYKPSQW